jgi:Lipase (class 3)
LVAFTLETQDDRFLLQATLAAYDIAARFPSLGVSCYTFGAPRTGNRAFADDYSRVVEDTWHIINGKRDARECGMQGLPDVRYTFTTATLMLFATATDQDLVTRGGKLAVFKRPGHRVLLKHGGMLVRNRRWDHLMAVC